MAELNLPIQRSAGRRIGSTAIAAPRVVMSWEDWLTFGAMLVTFLSIAVSIQQAKWVDNMPALVPTTIAGLMIGLFAARIRLSALVIQPVAIALGVVVVVLAAQSYADGVTLADRLADFRVRMIEWYNVVRAGDISNDNLPFVTLVHGATYLSAYLASWSIYRWHNAWFAVVPGGAVLLANISFQEGQPSGAFIVFVFGALLLIARSHLQHSQARWKRQGVSYPDFISVNATQTTLLIALALVVLAWTVPLGKQAKAVENVFDAVVSPLTNQSESFVRLFHNVDSRKGAPLHTFGSTLPIKGDVSLGTKVLYNVNSPQPGLVRATSYDEYTGTGWKVSDRESERVSGRADLPGLTPDARYKQRVVSILNVEVRDNESTILTAGTPLGSNLDLIIETPEGDSNDIERMRSRRALEKGDRYNALGSESIATEDQLRAAGTTYSDDMAERYLQLPDDLPDRVKQEARRVTANAATPYDKAKAIEDYLRTFPYDLAVESAPPRRDAVDFFLFELKRGYFDYQASAMAVMLRSVGVPARVAVGFVLDPAERTDTTYTVRKDDAYSWVEVFFPEYGWVNFNPTQDRPSGGAGGIGSGSATIDDQPIPSLDELFPVDEGFDRPLPDDVQEAITEEPVIQSDPPWYLLWILAAVLATVALGYLGARVTWNWGMGGLEGRARLWAKAHRLAGWAGLGGSPTETPREWSRRVGESVHVEDEAVRLARAYEESRYGRPELQRVDDDAAESAYRRLRNALAAKLFHYGRRKDGSASN